MSSDFDRIDALMAYTLGLSVNEWRVVRLLWKNKACSIDEVADEFYENPDGNELLVARATVSKVNEKRAKSKLPKIDSIRNYGYAVPDEFVEQLDQLYERFKK